MQGGKEGRRRGLSSSVLTFRPASCSVSSTLFHLEASPCVSSFPRSLKVVGLGFFSPKNGTSSECGAQFNLVI